MIPIPPDIDSKRTAEVARSREPQAVRFSPLCRSFGHQHRVRAAKALYIALIEQCALLNDDSAIRLALRLASREALHNDPQTVPGHHWSGECKISHRELCERHESRAVMEMEHSVL
jgi:hypothetical protein